MVSCFEARAERRIRGSPLLEADVIEAAIGSSLQTSFTVQGIPAAILILRKNKPKARKGRVLIVNGNATYQPGKAQNILTDDNIKALAEAFHDYADAEKFARLVPVQEIAANGFNLNISRYVQTSADLESVDVAVEVTKLQALMSQRDAANTTMFEHLEKLGYAK